MSPRNLDPWTAETVRQMCGYLPESRNGYIARYCGITEAKVAQVRRGTRRRRQGTSAGRVTA